MQDWEVVEGGVTAASGFQAAGVHAGLKASAPDMAMIVSDRPAAVAGTLTKNRIQGAHIKLCRERLAGGCGRAVVINSGSANACTGPRGPADARRMAALAAERLGVEEEHVFVCSTGTIGKPLPMAKVEAGIQAACQALSPEGGASAARAIMTTDTRAKQYAVRFTVNGVSVTLGGMAKGAGMIEPNMATMLAYLTTDAAVERGALQRGLSAAVDLSFNRISVDGDQSCNDTVLCLANGAAGNAPLHEEHPDWHLWVRALSDVTLNLALQLVEDGEGVTKVVTVEVVGAATPEDARLAVRAIGRSLLVKTSWYGGDPNWGRVIDAVGYSGAQVVEERVDISYDEVCAIRGGQLAPNTTLKDLEKVLANKRFRVRVNLNLGTAADTLHTCDCSEEYVRINSAYLT